jgi:2-polyprenyl-6-methoxyphenol hydroxylase-like FAD-dependent oxidoreductase
VYRVLIAGGGIAGSALALFLQKAGMEAIVFETAPSRQDIGGALQIAPNGMNVLGDLGLAGQVISAGSIANRMVFRNQTGKPLASVPNGGPPRHPFPAVMIARAALHEMLVTDVPVQYGKRLGTISEQGDKVRIEFDDGTSAGGDLLVGADGIWSATRQALLPAASKPVYTSLFNTGGFAHVSATAAQEAAGTLNLTFGAHGFFGDPTRFLWWTTVARDLESDATHEPTLTARHWHHPIPELIANSGPPLQGPIYDLPDLPVWHRGRSVLIGDAAHAMSPHAGQGASMALEDAQCLSMLLASRTYEKAFPEFERRCRHRVTKLALQARRSGNNKRELTPTACRIRDFIMSLALPLFLERSQNRTYDYRVTSQPV